MQRARSDALQDTRTHAYTMSRHTHSPSDCTADAVTLYAFLPVSSIAQAVCLEDDGSKECWDQWRWGHTGQEEDWWLGMGGVGTSLTLCPILGSHSTTVRVRACKYLWWIHTHRLDSGYPQPWFHGREWWSPFWMEKLVWMDMKSGAGTEEETQELWFIYRSSVVQFLARTYKYTRLLIRPKFHIQIPNWTMVPHDYMLSSFL